MVFRITRTNLCSILCHKAKMLGKLFKILSRIKLLMNRIWWVFTCYMFVVSVYRSVETNFWGNRCFPSEWKNEKLSPNINSADSRKKYWKQFFFICQLPALRPYLGHCRKDRLTNPKSITTFLILNLTRRSREA